MTNQKKYDVAAYVWPSYTGDDPRTRIFWPAGIGEWETVAKATKKFPEHNWPRKPLWGYVNEADPRVMEMEIAAAADHGVNVFIYDWYWYDRRPFLENCLNDGYLKARNNDRAKFYLMWANHDVNTTWDIRLAGKPKDSWIWLGSVDRPEFERLADRLIGKYFTHPSYYRIEDKPVFMIYELQTFINGLGGVAAAGDALSWFRKRAVAAGLPGLHLQACVRGASTNLSGVDGAGGATQAKVVEQLAFDSMTHYQFVHFTGIDRVYNEIMKDVLTEWERLDRDYAIPYFPHISVGWDNNPRFDHFRRGIVRENTPDAIREALLKARQYADAHANQPPLITINSWNEWTETSYLQPDDLYGYGYLEAVRDVFL